MDMDARRALVADWFESFVVWIREHSDVTLEIASDTAAELYLNSLTAQHLRQYGRHVLHHRGIERFWARCEWNKTDICFGITKHKLPNTSNPWNTAWAAGETGDIGQIEAKVVYSHHEWKKPFAVVKEQLARRAKDERESESHQARGEQLYYALMWNVDYEWVKNPRDWTVLFGDELSARVGEHPSGEEFIPLGELDMDSVWPSEDWGMGTLGVTLREWRPD